MMDERPFEGWFCRDGETVIGPLGRARLRQLTREGRLRPEDILWSQRLPEGELLAPVSAGEVLRRDRFAALVVDDDLAAGGLLARLIREAAGDQCVICTGSEAVRATTALEPEAVFLDLELACVAGYALAAALRQLPRPPRVVALMGENTSPARKRVRAAGFRHWLAKPADPERLRELLAHFRGPVAKT